MHRWPWIALGSLTLVTGAMLGWQRRTAAELRGELAMRRAETAELIRLQAEHQRVMASQPTAADLADRAAVAELRAELEALRRRASASAVTRRAEVPAPPRPTPPLTGNILAHPLWQNRGAATPAAAFETTLWASAGGDIDALAALLTLDPDAKSQATALFAQLPANLQAEFVSPERLVAVLTAKDVPLGRATILAQYPADNATQVSAQIFDAAGSQKVTLFTLRLTNDRWQLVVPGNAVKRYAAWLQAPPTVAPAKP